MTNSSPSRYSSQAVMGIILLLIGVGFLLNSLEIWQFGRILATWWPLIIIFFGLMGIMSNTGIRTGAYITLIVGIVLQLWALNIVTINIWSLLWPLILIGIGLSIILHRPRAVATSAENAVDLHVAFGGIDRKITTKGFTGGNVTALFGGISLDLREAEFAEKATLNISATFGGVDIRVPQDVKVQISGTPLFGGWEDKTEKDTTKKMKQLEIKGSVLFGGISVKD